MNHQFSADQYRENGFTGPLQILTPGEAAEARRSFFGTIRQSEATPGPMNEPPGGFDLRYRWVYDLATRNQVLDHAEQILGPDIVLWATVFWYKEPHNSSYIPWHQDATYWPMSPRINLTVWIALGPTFRENGCLSLIPGSHRHWLDDQYRTLEPGAGFSEGLSDDQVDESRAVHLEMSPGEAVFFTEATLHRSDANVSDVPRVAFALRLTTPEVRFDIDGLKEKGIDYLARSTVVRGTDRFRYNKAMEVAPGHDSDGRLLP